MLDLVTLFQNCFVLRQLTPLLCIPEILNHHLHIRNVHILRKSSGDVVILIPFSQHFQALQEQRVPNSQIDLLHLVVRTPSWIFIGCWISIKLSLSTSFINLFLQSVNFFFDESISVLLEIRIALLDCIILCLSLLHMLRFNMLHKVLWKLSHIFSRLVLLIVHKPILPFLLCIVNYELAELLIDLFPHVMLSVSDH